VGWLSERDYSGGRTRGRMMEEGIGEEDGGKNRGRGWRIESG
jgi:hypothetical protein